MNKKAIIFHGTGCTPDDFWYPWLGGQLRQRGFAVEIPDYPNINHEPIETFLPKVLAAHIFDEDTTLIGHSAGGPLILSILEKVTTVIPQAIFVAGFSYPLPDQPTEPILQSTYDWSVIKKHVQNPVFINSVNDPWGCDDKQGRLMFDKLGGIQIICNDGHFGSNARNQAYPTFELVNQLVQ